MLSAGRWDLGNTCSVTFGAVDRTATWGGELVLVRRFFFFVFSTVHFFVLSFVMALNRPVVMPEAFSGEATDERDWPAYIDYFAECSALNGWQADGQDHRARFLSVRLRGAAQRFASTLPLQPATTSRSLQEQWESVLPQLTGRRSIRLPLKLVASCQMSPSRFSRTTFVASSPWHFRMPRTMSVWNLLGTSLWTQCRR